jgi:hypothetical protein
MLRVAFGFTVLAIVGAAAVGAWSGDRRSESDGFSGRQAETIVVAELFTSEGCSSCPPADRLLETLLHQQPASGVYVIPLSEHVDYWDHQGWKDPFSSAQFTDRQKLYGLRFNVDSIYTPQLVIDGTSEFVGSDERELKRALAKAAGEPKPYLQVDLTGTGAETAVAVHGPGLAASRGEATELMVAVTEDDLVVDVKRGENASRTLHHSGVVRSLQSLGDPKIAPRPSGAVDAGKVVVNITLALKPDWKRDKLRVVAFVQSKKTRRILSVGWRAVS